MCFECFFKMLLSSPSSKGPDVQWKSPNEALGKNKKKKVSLKKSFSKKGTMREEKEEIQQNLSTYSTLHEIKIHALFSDRCFKNSH